VGDYLRALFTLAEGGTPGSRATTNELAARLTVRPASVTAMLQKLAAADPPLVEYHKHHGARLTAAGERAALALVRCHRLLELFLHEKLGFGWDEVHDEADRLEHVIGAALADRLAAALGHPTHDPHGHAIPAADLSLDAPAAVCLRDLPPGSTAVVAYVADEDAALLRRMDALGLRPGAAVVVVAAGGADMRLRLGDAPRTQTVTAVVAERVFVRQTTPHHNGESETQ
jgi:DtxR family Mn-dependent transcriptional regulator